MIHVSFELDKVTEAEAHQVVRLLDTKFPGMLAGPGGVLPSQPPVFTHTEKPIFNLEPVKADGAIPDPQPEAKRRGRPKKEVAAEPEVPTQAPSGAAVDAAPSPEPPSQPAAAGEAKVLTVDELRAGLQKFTVKHGMVKGKELLDSFGCARVTELAEKGAEVHAQFMAKCDA